MNQYSAIREVRRLLRAVMEQSQRPELIEQLEEIDVRLKAFHDRGIDFKEVVDGWMTASRLPMRRDGVVHQPRLHPQHRDYRGGRA